MKSCLHSAALFSLALIAACSPSRNFTDSESSGGARGENGDGDANGGRDSGGSNLGGMPGGASGDGDSGGTGSGGNENGGSSTGGNETGGEPAETIYVTCGEVECPVHEGGKCCWDETLSEAICQGSSASCNTTGSGPYEVRVPLFCDGTDDCGQDEICCWEQGEGAPYAGASCEAIADCPYDKPVPVVQVCDPDHKTPSDCLAGTCGTQAYYGLTHYVCSKP